MPCPHSAATTTTAQRRRTVLGERTCRCPGCRRFCNERTGTPDNHRQYPTDRVLLVVRRRLRHTLRLRDRAAMFLARGRVFGHEAVRDWAARFAPRLADRLRAKRRGQAGSTWHADEPYVKGNGAWWYAYRAIARAGHRFEAPLREQSDMAAAWQCCAAALAATGHAPPDGRARRLPTCHPRDAGRWRVPPHQPLQAGLGPATLVFLDERGAHVAMTPCYARAPRGQWAYGRVPHNWGDNVTLVATRTRTPTGPGPAMTLAGALDGPAFLAYVRELLLLTLVQGQTLVLDNLAVHHAPPSGGSSRPTAATCSSCRLTRPITTRSSWRSPSRRPRSAGRVPAPAPPWRRRWPPPSTPSPLTRQPTWFRHCGYHLSGQPLWVVL